MAAKLRDLEGITTLAPSGRKLVGRQQLPAVKATMLYSVTEGLGLGESFWKM
jgi:hypothetical protein